MIEYWTVWNLSLFGLYIKKYIKPSLLLLTSLVVSSIIGFMLINIYPCTRKVIIRNKEYEIPYIICFLGDITNHQLPLLYTFFIDNFKIKSFGEEIILVGIFYYIINYIRKLNYQKIYNVDNIEFHIIILFISIIFLTISLLII